MENEGGEDYGNSNETAGEMEGRKDSGRLTSEDLILTQASGNVSMALSPRTVNGKADINSHDCDQSGVTGEETETLVKEDLRMEPITHGGNLVHSYEESRPSFQSNDAAVSCSAGSSRPASQSSDAGNVNHSSASPALREEVNAPLNLGPPQSSVVLKNHRNVQYSSEVQHECPDLLEAGSKSSNAMNASECNNSERRPITCSELGDRNGSLRVEVSNASLTSHENQMSPNQIRPFTSRSSSNPLQMPVDPRMAASPDLDSPLMAQIENHPAFHTLVQFMTNAKKTSGPQHNSTKRSVPGAGTAAGNGDSLPTRNFNAYNGKKPSKANRNSTGKRPSFDAGNPFPMTTAARNKKLLKDHLRRLPDFYEHLHGDVSYSGLVYKKYEDKRDQFEDEFKQSRFNRPANTNNNEAKKIKGDGQSVSYADADYTHDAECNVGDADPSVRHSPSEEREKAELYYGRPKINNEAAMRRRARYPDHHEEIHLRSAFLALENSKLTKKVSLLKEELARVVLILMKDPKHNAALNLP